MRRTLLVLSGGVALGAYQAGACAALLGQPHLTPDRVAGSSIGAVNAAIIAGNPPERRAAQLRAFWDEAALEMAPLAPPPPWRHAFNWLSVAHTRFFGRAGQFRPRPPYSLDGGAPSLYEFTPLRSQLEKYVDFARLNAGEPSVCVVTTDVESGEEVAFDTRAGANIGPDHILASCGFLPDFPLVEIGGRLLGDGGLVANAPVEAALRGEESTAEVVCFIVDLFSPAGARPKTLEQAAARRWDLLFGNQTRAALGRLERERRFRPVGPSVKVLHLAYRSPPHEAGPEKPFDFLRQTLEERWHAGRADMEGAVELASGNGNPERRSVQTFAW